MTQLNAVSLSVLLSLGVAGCATQPDVRYAGITSSAQWSSNKGDSTGRVPLAYSRAGGWSGYNTVILEPVIVYTAPDQQFGDLTISEVMQLKAAMDHDFKQSLSRNFRLAPLSANQPGTLRVQLTLTGAQRNTPFLTTFSRFDIGMGSYNLVQSLRDRKGTFSGSVSYAVEVYDGPSNQLLSSFLTKQYPTVYNIQATRGPLTGARAGISRGAKELASTLAEHQ